MFKLNEKDILNNYLNIDMECEKTSSVNVINYKKFKKNFKYQHIKSNCLGHMVYHFNADDDKDKGMKKMNTMLKVIEVDPIFLFETIKTKNRECYIILELLDKILLHYQKIKNQKNKYEIFYAFKNILQLITETIFFAKKNKSFDITHWIQQFKNYETDNRTHDFYFFLSFIYFLDKRTVQSEKGKIFLKDIVSNYSNYVAKSWNSELYPEMDVEYFYHFSLEVDLNSFNNDLLSLIIKKVIQANDDQIKETLIQSIYCHFKNLWLIIQNDRFFQDENYNYHNCPYEPIDHLKSEKQFSILTKVASYLKEFNDYSSDSVQKQLSWQQWSDLNNCFNCPIKKNISFKQNKHKQIKNDFESILIIAENADLKNTVQSVSKGQIKIL